MHIVDAATTRRHLGFAELIDALRTMFVAGCEVPQRHVHTIADAEGGAPRGTVLVMPAWRPGRRFGLKTVAEGIETTHESHKLQGIGCNVGQGYLFARPMSKVQLIGTMRRRLMGRPAA